jgi:hypothetical protein
VKRAYFKSVKQATEFFRATARIRMEVSLETLPSKRGWRVRWY